MVGTSQIFFGGFGGLWTCWQAGSACAGGDGILTPWPRAILWISGESRAFNRTVV